MSNSNDSKEPLYHQQLKESLDDSSKQTTVAAPEAPSLPYCHQQLRESHDTHVPSSSSQAPSYHHPIREHQQSTGGWNPHGPPYYTSDPPNNAGVLSAGTYHSHNDIRSQQSHPPHGMGSKFHQHNMAPPPPQAQPTVGYQYAIQPDLPPDSGSSIYWALLSLHVPLRPASSNATACSVILTRSFVIVQCSWLLRWRHQ